jgi:hypothetical protein
MIDIENLSDLELDELQARYEKIRAACDERQKKDGYRRPFLKNEDRLTEIFRRRGLSSTQETCSHVHKPVQRCAGRRRISTILPKSYEVSAYVWFAQKNGTACTLTTPSTRQLGNPSRSMTSWR